MDLDSRGVRVGPASRAGPAAAGILATVFGAVELPGPAGFEMESEVLDASNPYTVGGDYLILDQDPYETDIYEVPDPGLLKEERGEVAWAH